MRRGVRNDGTKRILPEDEVWPRVAKQIAELYKKLPSEFDASDLACDLSAAAFEYRYVNTPNDRRLTQKEAVDLLKQVGGKARKLRTTLEKLATHGGNRRHLIESVDAWAVSAAERGDEHVEEDFEFLEWQVPAGGGVAAHSIRDPVAERWLAKMERGLSVLEQQAQQLSDEYALGSEAGGRASRPLPEVFEDYSDARTELIKSLCKIYYKHFQRKLSINSLSNGGRTGTGLNYLRIVLENINVFGRSGGQIPDETLASMVDRANGVKRPRK